MAADQTAQRVERTAWYACAGMAVLALIMSRGAPGPAVAVLSGGALIALGYWSLKSGVSLLDAPVPAGPSRRRRSAATILKVAGRYALLGFLAYVMIARLRLHPVGLLAGASSFVAAVSIETLRLLIRKH
jgi:hypothetical protein